MEFDEDVSRLNASVNKYTGRRNTRTFNMKLTRNHAMVATGIYLCTVILFACTRPEFLTYSTRKSKKRKIHVTKLLIVSLLLNIVGWIILFYFQNNKNTYK